MFIEALTVIVIILAIFFFLGLCIMIHELGHLLCALWRGLHVERFSIGFGKKLWGFSRNGVEYRISILPFGGYVALPQLEPGDQPRTESGQKLPLAKPFDRVLTALAGPFFNILLGFVLGTMVWLVGVERPRQLDEFTVHQVQESSPEFEAGLRPGDRIVEVNGEQVRGGWETLVQKIALTAGQVELTIRRNDQTRVVSYQPRENPEWEGLGYPFFEVNIPVLVQRVEPGSPADQAGISAGDQILEINRQRVHNSYHFIQSVRDTDGEYFSMTMKRDGQTYMIDRIKGELHELNGETRFLIGVQPGEPMEIRHLSPWWQFRNVLTTTRETLTALISRDSLVGPRHMSGPVGIIQINYMTIRYRGWSQGLFFVVFVSFSLALFNLLPIPVLDGGHIVFGFLELISGKRAPVKVAWYIQTIFAILLISFMLYVTFYDISRLGRTLRRDPEPGGAEVEELEEGGN